MKYKELVKEFNMIRDYMRDFFVYGFKMRGDIGTKSERGDRTYDDRRRQIASWINDYMAMNRRY